MPPFSLRIGRPDSSVCVTHQGWGSPSTVVQPFQVMPWKMKGKLHSEFESAPDTVEQVVVLEDGGGAETPERKPEYAVC